VWNYGLAVTVFKVRRRSGGQPLVTMGSEDHILTGVSISGAGAFYFLQSA